MSLLIDESGAPVALSERGAESGLIKNSDTQGFAADVMEVSKTTPVIVDFWSPSCGPCKQLTPLLEKLVRQAGGLVRLVKINVDENHELAAQLRIQSVPTVFGFKHGQPVDGFAGAQAESQVQAFIKRLTGGAETPVEEALGQAKATLDGGDPATASALYAQILSQEQANGTAIGGLIRCYLASGEIDHAREMVAGLEDDILRHGDVVSAITALDLADVGDAVDLAELRGRIDKNANDHQARLDLAQALFAGGEHQAAIDELLESIRLDRGWNDAAARQQLLKIFEALGGADPLTVSGRRGLSSILFS